MKKLSFNKRDILIFIIGGIVFSSVVVFAESINSNEVLYDNSNSGSSATDVQDALDDVYNTLDKVGSGYSLIAHAPAGLSTELEGGLYRYQGVQDESNDVNNYICFGTTNKSTCTDDVTTYMYRIIGINELGQMKLIKRNTIGTYAWHSSKNVEWINSNLKAGLNGEYFLTNTTYIPDSTWSNRIASASWYYPTISNGNMAASAMYTNEMAAPNIEAKIGLMNLHDYYYGLPGGINCAVNSNQSTCKSSWLHLTKT